MKNTLCRIKIQKNIFRKVGERHHHNKSINMSLRNTYFPQLSWSCKIEILAFLTLREIWLLGNCSKGAFVTFLRERDARIGESLSSARYLPHGHSVERTCLVSYPRSGNSYLRRILEVEPSIESITILNFIMSCFFKLFCIFL